MKIKFITVNGEHYTLLGMYSGIAHLGKPLDVNNNIIKSGIIWEMGGWKYGIPFFKTIRFIIYRFFKKDCFGNWGFKNLI